MTEKTLRLILGNQLFPLETQKIEDRETVFMCEDSGLCTYEKHHKSKIALFFNAMRSFRDSLEQSNIRNIYYDFNNRFNDPFTCLLYTSPSPRDRQKSRMPSSA